MTVRDTAIPRCLRLHSVSSSTAALSWHRLWLRSYGNPVRGTGRSRM